MLQTWQEMMSDTEGENVFHITFLNQNVKKMKFPNR